MGGDCQRTRSCGAHGGDQGESVRNVVCVERTDYQRDAGVLPDSGTDSGDRVRAPAAWGRSDDAHPYDLPGSDERSEVIEAGNCAAASNWPGPLLPLLT